MKTISFEQECDKCGGTGLYVGVAERNGVAVVCHHCGGTGKFLFIHKYNEPEKRKPRTGIVRVLQVNPGIMAGINPQKGFTEDIYGGIPHEDWIKLKQPDRFPPKTEMRKFVCPCWWYQSADFKQKPQWEECDALGKSFSNCACFPNKNMCWERFDAEKEKKEKQ